MTYRTCIALALLVAACSNDQAVKPMATDVGTTIAPDVSVGANPDASLSQTIRIATYNTSLYRDASGQLLADLTAGDSQARQIADVLQRVRPDVVVLNEFDWDSAGEAARIFAEDYLAVAQNGEEPLQLEHRYVPRSNTGVHSGVDLDGNGEAVDTPGSNDFGNDAFGFGTFEGQYGMVVLSRFPLKEAEVRTFQEFRWSDMPDSLLPSDWYSPEATEVLRLSSKNHIDVPVDVDGKTLHVLASHPTPPAFDGDEDRNGRRNHDETRFWLDYVSGASDYIVDDSGQSGGLADTAHFAVFGDLNCDPVDGEARREALVSLLSSDRVQDPKPTSGGGVAAASRDGQANSAHQGDPALDTADFTDGRVGNIRVDYVLPSSTVTIVDSGVYWPAEGAEAELAEASDHRLVWVDIVLP